MTLETYHFETGMYRPPQRRGERFIAGTVYAELSLEPLCLLQHV